MDFIKKVKSQPEVEKTWLKGDGISEADEIKSYAGKVK